MAADPRFPHLSGEHESVHYYSDPGSGLRAILAIHDTSRGPALGGIRTKAYPSEDQALADVLKLARAMTLKTALAGIPAGGGKVVVLEQDLRDRSAAFRVLGERIDELGGRFFTSGDLGTSLDDLAEVGKSTRHVTGPSQGDLSESTAEGVFLAAGTCLDVFGIAEWNGVRIAIQGLGQIGLRLATFAARAGAEVIAAEIDPKRIAHAVDTLGLTIVPSDEIYDVPCEVFAPCAAGGTLNPDTIPRLQCRIVAGAANNQLHSDECGDRLAAREILYAPDFVVNSGAVIRGSGPSLEGYEVPATLDCIGRITREIVLESMGSGDPTHRVAKRKAESLWQEARSKRTRKGPAPE